MSEWKRVEQPTDPTPDPITPPEPDSIPAPIPVAEELPFDPAAELPPLVDTTLPEPVTETVVPTAPAPAKPTKKREKKPRRRNGMAAPLGFLVLVLALIGAVSIVVSSIGWIGEALDDSALKAELEEFLEPVTVQNPTAFEGEKEAAANISCIKAALWKINEAERIRMNQERDKCRFKTDEFDRFLIDEKEVNEAFSSLFGEVSPDTSVFATQKDGFSIWYNADKKQYHVPAFAAALYLPVIDTVEQDDGVYTLRMGYVAAEDIRVDDQGNDIPPTPDDATVFQYFTLRETADGYQLQSIADAVPGKDVT